MINLETYDGPYLKRQLKLNRRSITVSAKQLGISVEELQSYFNYEKFDLDFLNNIIITFNLRHVVEIPDADTVTTKCIDEFEKYEKKIKDHSIFIAYLVKSLQELYSIAIKNSPEGLYKKVMDDLNNNIKEVRKRLDF